MKTQQEIDLLADVYYDGMASVIDRLEAIDKVEETNKYIKEKFGKMPSDESELIIECRTNELKSLDKTPAHKWLVLITLVHLLLFLSYFAVLYKNEPATILCSILMICVLVVWIFRD